MPEPTSQNPENAKDYPRPTAAAESVLSHNDVAIQSIIQIAGRIAFILYGSLALSMLSTIALGLWWNKWDLAVLTSLIQSVSSGANYSMGFIGGLLTQGISPPKSPAITGPVPVTNVPGEAIKVEEESDSKEDPAVSSDSKEKSEDLDEFSGGLPD